MANTVLKFQITLTETWFSTSSTWKLEQSTICSLLWVKVNNIEKRRRKRRRTHHCNSIFKFPWFNFSLSVHHTLSQKSATYFGISCYFTDILAAFCISQQLQFHGQKQVHALSSKPQILKFTPERERRDSKNDPTKRTDLWYPPCKSKYFADIE